MLASKIDGRFSSGHFIVPQRDIKWKSLGESNSIVRAVKSVRVNDSKSFEKSQWANLSKESVFIGHDTAFEMSDFGKIVLQLEEAQFQFEARSENLKVHNVSVFISEEFKGAVHVIGVNTIDRFLKPFLYFALFFTASLGLASGATTNYALSSFVVAVGSFPLALVSLREALRKQRNQS